MLSSKLEKELRRIVPRYRLQAAIQSPTSAPCDSAPSFAFRGGVADAFKDRSPELLVSGPAGTGKTLAILRRMHLTACKYPNSRQLIVRKTRASLTESTLVTYERDILGHGHPVLTPPILRRVRQSYRYDNASEIVVAGMDKPDKVLSSEWDIIYAAEATELTAEDWETLTGRLRNGRVPYQQMIADCNPTTPVHWLYKRYQAKRLTLVPTTHRDNPRYWDGVKGDWTDAGREYLGRLERLTGPRRARFLEGRWAQAEGLCFENWNAETHIINPFVPPREWPRYMAIDFGFTNPFVCQWWAKDQDGRLYLYREIYKTKTLVEDHCKTILQAMGSDGKNWAKSSDPKPVAVVCDHDAEGRATLERHLGLSTTAAEKAVTSGIQDVDARLKVSTDGKPRLFIMRDARCHKADVELSESGRPTCTAEEFDGYVWDKDAGEKERPVKENDHGADCARYVCKHLAGKVKSEGIRFLGG